MFICASLNQIVTFALADAERWSALESQEKDILWFTALCLLNCLPAEAEIGKMSTREPWKDSVSQNKGFRWCYWIYLLRMTEEHLTPTSSRTSEMPNTSLFSLKNLIMLDSEIICHISSPSGLCPLLDCQSIAGMSCFLHTLTLSSVRQLILTGSQLPELLTAYTSEVLVAKVLGSYKRITMSWRTVVHHIIIFLSFVFLLCLFYQHCRGNLYYWQVIYSGWNNKCTRR